MFMFNKNNAPSRSRQSSVDSAFAGSSPLTPISTSNTETWVAQGSDASSFRDMPSPEQPLRVLSAKRSSVFNLRSRGNTATSTAPSLVSLAPPGMAGSDTSPQRSSRDSRQFAGQSFMDLPGSKRSMFLGKKSKRLSGQFSPNFHVDERQVESVSKRTSVLQRGKRIMNHSEDSFHNLKNRISSPFDFQHLTHADRHQFAAMEQAPVENVSEFQAVRASHHPRRDDTGIKPEHLHFQNSSSEDLIVPPSRSASALGFVSPPPDPDQSIETSPASSKSIRMTRSVESFSQPTSPRFHRHTQSANPPPRMSSRMPLTRIDDLPEEVPDINKHVATKPLPQVPVRSRSNRYSGFWDSFAPLSPPSSTDKLPAMIEEPSHIGHAVTTREDIAIHPATPLSPPFSPDLGGVAEEPEKFTHPRPAPHPPARSPKSSFPASFSFGNSQRSPPSRPNSRRNSNPRGLMTRPISQMSDTVGSLPRKNSVRRAPSVRRISNTWRVIEGSWEDDVDYIYDNALEADCDFDWDNTSDNGHSDDGERTLEQSNQEHFLVAASSTEYVGPTQPKTFPPLLAPIATRVPGLASRSAVSVNTDNSVQTPSDVYSHDDLQRGPFAEAEGFSLTPSLLVPADFKEQVSREDMYHDLLADYEDSDRHFPLLDASQSVSSSTRSSRVRSSKRSSYDSSLMSSSGLSGSWNSSVRRSASSSGSLPELIHSRRARKDFSIVVDRLSAQIASYTAFDDEDAEENEDNDVTPPGRQSRELTFFSTEEDSDNQTIQTSIEGEVRDSLELARQGSTGSSRAPPLYHKHASSDGAAKLLAAPMQEPPKPRKRAASSSNPARANRQTHFSLFPVPPKIAPHSPLPSPLSS